MKHDTGDALRFWQRTLNVIDNTVENKSKLRKYKLTTKMK